MKTTRCRICRWRPRKTCIKGSEDRSCSCTVKGEYGPLNPILFSPQKKACARLFPTSSHRQPVRVAEALRIGPACSQLTSTYIYVNIHIYELREIACWLAWCISGPRAAGIWSGAPAANQLAGVRRARSRSFVQNEPLECTLPVQERPRPAGARVRGAICCVFIGRTIGRASRGLQQERGSRNP